MNEIYQESYCKDNSKFFSKGDDIPYYLVIGKKGNSFEDDLAIPVTKDYFSNDKTQNGKTLKEFLEEYILNENENSFLDKLQLGNIVDIDISLRQRLKNTFNELKNYLTSNKELEIYSEPLDIDEEDWQINGHIGERKIKLEDLVLNSLMYIEINAPDKGYIDVKQYMARFKICTKPELDIKDIKILPRKIEIISGPKFGPIETPIIDYDPDKFKMMKIDIVKKRINERKKWLPTYSDVDLLYLIFAPIRFLRFKHSQGRLNKYYSEQGKSMPSIISDIRDNSLLGGIWEYKDLEFLMQIDLLVNSKIIVPTDFNYHCPPYTTLYKVLKDGVMLVGDIEHDLRSPREEDNIREGIRETIHRPGHFVTYTCMKKMGSEGTQVLIKYQNEIGTTNKMLTCKEMDMEMADMNGAEKIKGKIIRDSAPVSGHIIQTSKVSGIKTGKSATRTGKSSTRTSGMTRMTRMTVKTQTKNNNNVHKSKIKPFENDYQSQIYHDPRPKNPKNRPEPEYSLYRGYRG